MHLSKFKDQSDLKINKELRRRECNFFLYSKLLRQIYRLRQIQDEEYKEVERKIMEQQTKQNDYEKLQRDKMEQEEKVRHQLEEDERKKQEHKMNSRKVILDRIPQEPAEDDSDAVLIIFRSPDGRRLERRFKTHDKALVYFIRENIIRI